MISTNSKDLQIGNKYYCNNDNTSNHNYRTMKEDPVTQ